jgi:HlyD family secretion protein
MTSMSSVIHRGSSWVAVLAFTALGVTGCGDEEPDAYGNFEATELVVSAEVGGPLTHFYATEGSRLPAGSLVGLVDTTQIALQIAELRAQQSAGQALTGQAAAQAGALEAQLRSAEREHSRIRVLHADQAATEQQLEQARSQVEVLREQVRAARQQTAGTREQTGATEARIAQLEDRLLRSHVRNPVPGTVLATYASPGEFVQPGQPLYRVADLDTLTFRAYLSGAQLDRVRLGQQVQVRVDAAGEMAPHPGRVSWIAATAEFTPTPIQTRDERAHLVYAVKVRVANPQGALRIGMPGEIELTTGDPSRRPAAQR